MNHIEKTIAAYTLTEKEKYDLVTDTATHIRTALITLWRLKALTYNEKKTLNDQLSNYLYGKHLKGEEL